MAGTDFFINIFTKGAKKSSKEVKGLNKALGGLKSQAMAAAGAFLGAGALVAGIKKATDAFAEQELAEKKLQQALGSSTTALLNQASALQKTSVFGDEATIAQQAFLASLKFSEEQIKTIIPVAMDLAAATGMSLESAVRNTAKTFSGLAGELGEMVPQLRELTAEEMKAGKAVEVMADLFGGAALTETESLSGSLQQMRNAVGDAAEVIGGILAPAVIEAAGFFKGAAEAVGGFLTSLQSLSAEEIQSAQNQEKLAERIGKVKDQLELAKDQAELAGSRFSNEFQRGLGDSSEKVIELENELALLQARYSNLSMVMLVPTEGIVQQHEQIKKQHQEEDDALTKKINTRNAYRKANKVAAEEEAAAKAQALKDDLKSAALSGQSASESMKSVVRAKAMEAVAGAISRIMTSIPFPASLLVAAGAGGLVSAAIDRSLGAIPSFATGGDFVTSGEQLIRVGDNPSGRERVQVTPLDAGGTPTGGGGAVNITFNSPIMSADHTEDVIIPQIKEAIRRGADIGVS